MTYMNTLELRRRGQFLAWALGLIGLLWLLPSQAAETFLAPEEAFQFSVENPAPGTASLHWTIAPGYYLYRERMSVVAAGGVPAAVVWPAGEKKNDPNFGAVEVYHGEVSAELQREVPAELNVTWQGCAEGGLCYPPRTVAVHLQNTSSPASDSVQVSPSPEAPRHDGLTDTGVSRMWSGQGLGWALPVAFLLGLGLAFTPCVLPMIPILSGLVVGQQASTRRAFVLSVAFVLPMAFIYAGLGVVAALAGAGVQALLQNPWTVLGFSLVFVVLAFSMFGFYELQLPAAVRDRLAGVSAQGGSVAGAAALGALSALLVGPCMTAPLAGTLLYIAQSGDVVRGGLLLLALGLGMGAPLVILSTLGAHWLPRPGPWMNRVKGAFGFIMLGTATWMAQRVLPEAVGLLAWGALLGCAALTSWNIAHTRPERDGAGLVLRSVAWVAGVWSLAMILGAAAGSSDPLRPLAQVRAVGHVSNSSASEANDFEVVRDPAVLQARLDAARAQGKAALVDFSADWCTSCKTLEREVFASPAVVPSLRGLVLLRADVTASSAAQQALMRRYQVMGPPTVLLFDATGVERREDRLVGEFVGGDLLKRLPPLKGGT